MLLTFIGALTLGIGGVGVMNIMLVSVNERTREIGLRRAVGARPNDVLKLVAGQGLELVAIGLGIGLAGELWLKRLLSSLLFGVKAADPLTLIATSFLLLCVGLLASYVPARQAARVDPIEALRCE